MEIPEKVTFKYGVKVNGKPGWLLTSPNGIPMLGMDFGGSEEKARESAKKHFERFITVSDKKTLEKYGL